MTGSQLLFIVSLLLTAPIPSEPAHTDWLGPQQYPLKHWGTKKLETKEAREKEFGAWEITVKVEKVKDFRIPEPKLRPPGGGLPTLEESPEAPFTIEKGKYKPLGKRDLAGEGLCIHTLLTRKPDHLSKTYYIARARVISGPLKGAIINMLDEHPRNSGTAGVFRIPADIKMEEGPLEVELIEVWGK